MPEGKTIMSIDIDDLRIVDEVLREVHEESLLSFWTNADYIAVVLVKDLDEILYALKIDRLGRSIEVRRYYIKDFNEFKEIIKGLRCPTCGNIHTWVYAGVYDVFSDRLSIVEISSADIDRLDEVLPR